ncbi:TraK family protein [Desulfobacter vibrioformis]|uniref:TraK family protein n=1 Tax=Desulfobacter vibrioformis TaxID=34031 RepID=UPI00054EE994|nr:TraK family protein [Desulfobacter vibrioformis]
MKPSCKSQYLAVHNEAKALLAQGYSKKTIYDHFIEKDKIHMSYVAWAKIMENHDQKFPFGQKKFKKEKPISQSPRKIRGKFSHSNDPYPIEDATDSIVEEKENEKPFNLIKKGE